MATLQELQGPGLLDTKLPTAKGALDKRLSTQNVTKLLEDYNKSKPGTVLQDLLSPETLLKLGIGVAGYLSGNPDISAAGGGLALGALSGAPGRVAQQQAEFQGKQQAMRTMLVSAPGQFVDENGQNIVDPAVLGEMSGLGVPINPAAVVQRARYSKMLEKQYDIASGLLRQGATSGDQNMILRGLQDLNVAGNMGWTDAQMSNLANTTANADMLSILLQISDPASVLLASKQATQEGGSIYDAKYISMLRPVSESDGLIRSIDDMTKKLAADAMDAYDAWTQGEGREIYLANPIAAYREFFEQPGRAKAKAAVESVYTHFGQRADKLSDIEVDALLSAWSNVLSLDPAIMGAYSLDPEARGELFMRTAAGFQTLNAEARGMQVVQRRQSRSDFWSGESRNQGLEPNRVPLYEQRYRTMVGDYLDNKGLKDESEVPEDDMLYLMSTAKDSVDRELNMRAIQEETKSDIDKLQEIVDFPYTSSVERTRAETALRKLQAESSKASTEAKELFDTVDRRRRYDKYRKLPRRPEEEEAIAALRERRQELDEALSAGGTVSALLGVPPKTKKLKREIELAEWYLDLIIGSRLREEGLE